MKHVLAVPLVFCLSIGAGCGPRRPSAQVDRKLVVLGFDGLDPDLVARWIDAGTLPNMRAVAARGALRPLETAASGSPASAWASFATGVNPGRHDIYGLFARDPATYAPAFALVRREPGRFFLQTIPTTPASAVSLRRGTSFWVRAGETGVRSSILAVPGTYPPEPVPNGELLSGFPIPDLLGGQGRFQYFGTDVQPGDEGRSDRGGIRTRLVFDGDSARADLMGPGDPIVQQALRERRAAPAAADADRIAIAVLEARETLRLPFAIHWNRKDRAATVVIGDDSVLLRQGEWSRWIDLDFRANFLVTRHGMAQMYLARADSELNLYVTPINWKPDRPPMPMSSPASLSADLFERLGYYRTLARSEAAGALNDGLIDEQAFMDDLFRAFDDRAEMILQRIDNGQWDLLVGVVDSTDRVQHMMWRFLDRSHPRYDKALAAKFGDAIERVYRRADDLVGEILARLDPDTPLLIVSDHGFHSFRQALDLDAWLEDQGFLARRPVPAPLPARGGPPGEGLDPARDTIDWTRTRAYAMGAGQIYLNLEGREPRGIVAPGAEARALEDDLASRLLALTDPKTGQRVVDGVYRAADMYSGPFAGHAPELQVGTADGYRVSRPAMRGEPSEGIIEANEEKWSGDHAGFDYRHTPGVLLSSRPLASDVPRIVDIAPTILRYFGIAAAAELDGRPLF
ncbi:MAG: alkaline phosphatase family protein [Acidobacteria bacterium]|nr:alkaline phosphatase family protein [Acidobacteriota bacterium]